MNMKYVGWFFCALLCGSAVTAQVKVVESSPDPKRGSTGSNAQAELFYQLQQLQQEVMDLRGQVEEQAYKIKKLTKQRKADYVNLDERISKLSGRKADTRSRSARLTADSSPASSSLATLPSGDPAAEPKVYKAAYALVKNQQFDDALSAFNDFILLYPSGEYAPNAHYWLGELYLYKSNLDRAIEEFSVIVDDYPRHRKAPDAMFKLAKAHHVKGDIETARSMLNRVISDYQKSDSKAPRLARDYLKNMLH